jgi:hypothetical protein
MESGAKAPLKSGRKMPPAPGKGKPQLRGLQAAPGWFHSRAMGKKDETAKAAQKHGKSSGREARAERLAEALRANLKRRKQQARARKLEK